MTHRSTNKSQIQNWEKYKIGYYFIMGMTLKVIYRNILSLRI